MSIFDNEEPYPITGTLEEKALYGMEEQRRQFYVQKKVYESFKEGGKLHTCLMIADGAEAANAKAAQITARFNAFLMNVMLTPEGETTDPKYPVDKMVNFELRRIRRVIIVSVMSFMENFATMMPDNLQDWNPGILGYNLGCYIYRYTENIYEDINTVIPQ